MIIFSGFWAGFASGAMTVAMLILCASIVISCKQESAKAKFADLLERLDSAARDKIQKGDSNSESNN